MNTVIDTYWLGASPYDEDCAQIGTPDYAQRAKAECRRYIDQLRRQFGPEPPGARLRVKSSRHDYGTYYEVVCEVMADTPEAYEYATNCDEKAWGEWRDEATEVGA